MGTCLKPEEWLQKDRYKGLVVLDPDGWDRNNYLSWNASIDMHPLMKKTF